MNTSISFALICALVALGAQIYSVINNHNKNEDEKKREKIELEKNLLRLDLKLDNLTTSMGALVNNDEKTTAELKDINASIIKFGESIKAAWRKIDDHEERITNIEQKK